MRTLTLVCNFVLLGIAVYGLLTGSSYKGLLPIAVIILNIAMVAGSSFRPKAYSSDERPVAEGRGESHSFYLFMKIFVISLNILLFVILSGDFRNGSGYLLTSLKAFLILTMALSIAVVAAGRWNRFRRLKRTILPAAIIVAFLIGGTFMVFRIIIGNGIRENISIAKKEYPGKAEDALLAYLADTKKSPQDRTKIAVWTLGQIRSEKALSVLKSLYRNDPEGRTCRHSTELCQYEIHKAIVSIESNWMGAKEKNVFGSWSRLNR